MCCRLFFCRLIFIFPTFFIVLPTYFRFSDFFLFSRLTFVFTIFFVLSTSFCFSDFGLDTIQIKVDETGKKGGKTKISRQIKTNPTKRKKYVSKRKNPLWLFVQNWDLASRCFALLWSKMAEKSNNRTDRLFSDNDDCPNLLYLATTKQINYHQPGRKGDTNSTNINLMDDTTDEFEKLNVKRNSASQSAAPGPAGAGPGTGSGPGSSGQAQGGPAPGPGGGPTPGAVGATKSMTLPMDIHTVPPIGAIAIGIGIDTLLNEDYDVNVKKDIQSSASGSASGSGSGFAGSSPMPSRSAFSKDVHGADRDHVDVHEYGPGDDFTIVSTAPPMASTAVDSTSTTTRNRTDIATSQIDRSLNRKSSQSTNIVHLADKLPNVNCPEKIVSKHF